MFDLPRTTKKESCQKPNKCSVLTALLFWLIITDRRVSQFQRLPRIKGYYLANPLPLVHQRQGNTATKCYPSPHKFNNNRFFPICQCFFSSLSVTPHLCGGVTDNEKKSPLVIQSSTLPPWGRGGENSSVSLRTLEKKPCPQRSSPSLATAQKEQKQRNRGAEQATRGAKRRDNQKRSRVACRPPV